MTAHRIYGIDVELDLDLSIPLPPALADPILTVEIADAADDFAGVVVDDIIAINFQGDILRVQDVGCGGPLTFEHMVVDLAIPYWMNKGGRPVLHAAALEKDGKSVLLAGPSGRGKSSLTLALLGHGWRLLSDDAVWLERRDGALLAHPSYPSLRAHPDTLHAMGVEEAGLGYVGEYTDKRRMDVDGERYVKTATLVAALIELGESGPLDLKPLGAARAASLVATHLLHSELDPGQALDQIDVGLTLSLGIPTFELRSPRTFDALNDVARLMAEMVK